MSSIDLHQTETVSEALFILERELFFCYKRGEFECRVIHGIGEGILASAVHEALTRNPMIKSWREEDHGGSCIVMLR